MSGSQVTFIPQEGEEDRVIIDGDVAFESVTLKDAFDYSVGEDIVFPAPHTPKLVVIDLFNYVKQSLDNPIPTKDDKEKEKERMAELPGWKKAFFQDISSGDNMERLFNFTIAANWFNIKYALDDSCKYIASIIKGKSPEEIRKTFQLKK